jgi:hypothetical protein
MRDMGSTVNVRRMGGWRAPLAAVVTTVPAVLAGPGVGPAIAGDPVPYAISAATHYQVTLVARSCESYAGVMANRVLDDAAESPGRPGRASIYKAGEAVDPDIEAANTAGCQPIVGWRFTLGGGRGRSGAFSTVTAAPSVTSPTSNDTPRLDPLGRPTGGPISGAVTVALTSDQVALASRRQLWAQGGTPDDPLGRTSFRNQRYAFGVLRCGLDGHTAGNTQWVGYPAGTRHIFCFAYYVRGAESGTLTVRVRPSRQHGYPQRFTFASNIGYTGSGELTVDSAGKQADASFVRAARTDAYDMQARLPDGWRLADLACAASRGSGAAKSKATTDAAAGKASVTLAAGETVICTYTVDPPAVQPGLTVRVHSDGGGGSFGVTVDGPGGQRALTAEPKGDGSAVLAGGADLSGLAAGAYTLTVAPPAADAAAWSLAGMTCNGADIKAQGLAAKVSLGDGAPQDCVLRMVRTAGALKLRIVTVGGTTTGTFAVAPAGAAAATWSQSATTPGSGVPVDMSGDLPGRLPFGTYEVTSPAPLSTVDGGWRLTTLACEPDAATPGAAGMVWVKLTLEVSQVTCTVTYQFVAATRLQVVVRAEGSAAGRTGPVLLEVTCADGSSGLVVLPAADFGRQTLPETLSFLDPTSCTLRQTSAGIGEHDTVVATVVVDPAPAGSTLTLPAQIDIARDVALYTVTVTNTFNGPGSTEHEATFPRTFRMLPAALIGSGMVGIGALILLILLARRRSTRQA